MNKAFEKIVERIDEELRKSEERYYRYLDDSNLPCMFDKSDIEEKRVDTIKGMLEIVKEVAEEYNGGWIPCSERLPEEYGEYLVWWTDITRGQYYEIVEYEPDNGWIGEIPQAFEGKYSVIAWQPLPEPFKERD